MAENNHFNRKMNMLIYDMVEVEGKYWFSYKDAIYSYDAFNMEVTKEQDLKIPDMGNCAFWGIANLGRKLFLSPLHTKDIAIYNIETKQTSFVNLGNGDDYSWYRRTVVFEKKIFMLPQFNSGFLILDEVGNIGRVHIDGWHIKEKYVEITSGYVVQDRYLWITAHCSNQVLKLDMYTEQYELIAIGDDSVGYTGITSDGEYLWLAESNTGALIRYGIQDGEAKKFCAPDDLDYNSAQYSYVHWQLFNFEKYIVSIPALCDKMTVLDKETHEFRCVCIDFFDAVKESSPNYMQKFFSTSNFGIKIDEATLWVQRSLDGRLAAINIKDFTYKTFALELVGDIRLYTAGSISYESKITSLDSFLYYLKDVGKSMERNHANVGAEIWTKVDA